MSSASEHGSVPWYAEMCSSTLTVTYSSGGHGERGVVSERIPRFRNHWGLFVIDNWMEISYLRVQQSFSSYVNIETFYYKDNFVRFVVFNGASAKCGCLILDTHRLVYITLGLFVNRTKRVNFKRMRHEARF